MYADAIVSRAVMEAVMDAAEDGEPMVLHGTVSERLFRVHGCGDIAVGIAVPSEGTSPDDGAVSALRGSLGSGLLMVVDPYAGELAMYIVDDDGCRPARALVSERSDPDGVAVPHVLLGVVEAGHEVADDAVEEEKR